MRRATLASGYFAGRRGQRSPEQGLHDVRYVLRVLRRNPGFTATTVLTLTLAISATTATFSVVDAVPVQPSPFPAANRLVTLWETDPEIGNRPIKAAPANLLDEREQATSFEHIAALQPYSVDLTAADEPEVLYGWMVTEGFFEALAAGAAHGRTFLRDEYRPGSGVVVVTDGLWRRRFDSDPDIVGRSVVLADEPYTVMGVLALSFELRLEQGRSDRDVFLPKAIAEYETFIRNGGWWQVIARTRPDVSLAEAQAAADHPRTNAGVGARVIPLQARQVESVRPVLLLLWGAVVLAPHRLRQRREPPAGPLRPAPVGVRGPRRGGRRPRSPAAPAPDRERRHRGLRRHRRARGDRLRPRPAGRPHAGRRAPPRAVVLTALAFGCTAPSPADSAPATPRPSSGCAGCWWRPRSPSPWCCGLAQACSCRASRGWSTVDLGFAPRNTAVLQAAFLGPGESRAARAAGRRGFGHDPAAAGCGARPGRVAGGLHGGRRWRGTAVVGGARPAGAHRSSWVVGQSARGGPAVEVPPAGRGTGRTPVGPRSEQDVLASGVTVWSAAPGIRVAHPAGRLAVDADLEPHQRRDRGVERVVSPVVVDEDWILCVEE